MRCADGATSLVENSLHGHSLIVIVNPSKFKLQLFGHGIPRDLEFDLYTGWQS